MRVIASAVQLCRNNPDILIQVERSIWVHKGKAMEDQTFVVNQSFTSVYPVKEMLSDDNTCSVFIKSYPYRQWDITTLATLVHLQQQ